MGPASYQTGTPRGRGTAGRPPHEQTGAAQTGDEGFVSASQNPDSQELESSVGSQAWPSGSFVVRFVEWDRNRTEAAMVVANNPAIQGDWTDGALEMLGRIQKESPNIMVAMNLDGLLASLKNSLETCEPPADFKNVDESVKTDYECPKCKFRWSGKQS